MNNLLKYIFRRILLILPTLLGITLVCFVVINLAPGGPVDQKLKQIRFGSKSGGATSISRGGVGVSEDVLNALKKQYGFDRPLMTRYALWLKNVAQLEFGKSYNYGRPALEVIASRLPVSVQFGAASFLITYSLSLFIGLTMAYFERKKVDKGLSFLLVVASSVPPFMFGILLLVFFAGGNFFELFPMGHLHSDNYYAMDLGDKIIDRLHHLVLPLSCYLIGSFTTLAFLCRNSLLEEINKDYIRTAWSLGVSRPSLYIKHALRNALIPLVTGIGGALNLFLAGSILVESIFQLKGVGLLGLEAIMARDYNVIMALIFLSSVALLVGNLIGDVIYVLVDPRIDFTSGASRE